MSLPLTESRVTPKDLNRFDGAFVTNSVIEVLPVDTVGDFKYEVLEIVRTLRAGYRRSLDASLFP